MAKAFKCDVCGRVFEGYANMEQTLNKQSEIILRHSLGIKFSPEMEQAQTYPKDLCKDCADSFTVWYRKQRDKFIGD